MYHNKVLEIVERTMSSISILGFLIIFTTFLCFESFNRKLFNRLVFYASFGNVASNVATLISRSTIDYAGVTMNEGLCRFQGFLIQWYAYDNVNHDLGHVEANLKTGSCQLMPCGLCAWH